MEGLARCKAKVSTLVRGSHIIVRPEKRIPASLHSFCMSSKRMDVCWKRRHVGLRKPHEQPFPLPVRVGTRGSHLTWGIWTCQHQFVRYAYCIHDVTGSYLDCSHSLYNYPVLPYRFRVSMQPSLRLFPYFVADTQSPMLVNLLLFSAVGTTHVTGSCDKSRLVFKKDFKMERGPRISFSTKDCIE
jgi:hypothetical protein